VLVELSWDSPGVQLLMRGDAILVMRASFSMLDVEFATELATVKIKKDSGDAESESLIGEMTIQIIPVLT
jgi:hypothetical protein